MRLCGEIWPAVGRESYHCGMVKPELLEQVLQLDESSRRELRDAIDISLGSECVSPEVAAIIDQRIAEADANPDDFVTLEDFMSKLRSRHTA